MRNAFGVVMALSLAAHLASSLAGAAGEATPTRSRPADRPALRAGAALSQAYLADFDDVLQHAAARALVASGDPVDVRNGNPDRHSRAEQSPEQGMRLAQSSSQALPANGGPTIRSGNGATPPSESFRDPASGRRLDLVFDHGTFDIRPDGAYPPILQIDENNHNRVTIARESKTPNDYALVDIARVTKYAGGTSGFVNSALRVQTEANAGDRDFEWSLLGSMRNRATAADGAENVAIYGQAQKIGGGITGAGVFELQDFFTGPDPTAGGVSVEIDHWATGTDAHNQRGLLDLVAGPRSDGVSDPAPVHIGTGLRLGAQYCPKCVNGRTPVAIDNGLVFHSASFGTLIRAFELGAQGAATGLDFKNVSFSGNAIQTPGFAVGKSGALTLTGLPTSPTGLPSGSVWRNGTALAIVP